MSWPAEKFHLLTIIYLNRFGERTPMQKSGGSWLMGGGSVKKELEKSQTTLEAATIDLQAKIEENGKMRVRLQSICR